MTPLWLAAIAVAGMPTADASPPAAPVAAAETLLPGPAPEPPAAVASRWGFADRIAALELALATTVVQQSDRWRFGALRAEASELYALAQNDRQRAAASSVAERIESFAAISERHRRLASAPAPAGPVDRPRPAADGSDLAPPVRLTKAQADSQQRHDVVGVLRPVVSKRPDAPRWAIVDEQGRLAALVTPSPENSQRLQRLAGRRVALDGRRGYLSELRQNHIVAERITPLQPLRR
ncbi:hypothetical protein [Botrimarina sp.]|uniref:hypothetical protein n=1 Tax=Botrimarina sp. TaxID=2795802 RepID=UPI0032EF854D